MKYNDRNSYVLIFCGLTLAFTYDDLSYNTIAAHSSTMLGTNNNASNAVDRVIETCMRTLDIGLNSPYKTVWWKVDLGGVYSIYSVNIIFRKYKESGCTTPNVYGISCDLSCPIIKHRTCNIESGSCFLCMPGWTGTYCRSKCEMGQYGENCRRPYVGNRKDKTICNHVTGHCVEGCAPGWTVSLCDKECDVGTYGYGCMNNCSGHCLNGSPCNKHIGHCDRGCNPGYTDSYCSRGCLLGHFGLNCRERCNGHCLNSEPCDHISGACPNGCRDGYMGTFCIMSCKAGYYGPNCSYVCSPNCKTCRPNDGLCTCMAGHNCTNECMKSYGENCDFKCNVQCINQTCDRFNGSCVVGCEDGKIVKQKIYRLDVSPWPIAFSITLVTTMIFISTTFIMLWRFVLKRNFLCDGTQPYWRSTSNMERAIVIDETSHYQDLNLSKEENTYQTLELQ